MSDYKYDISIIYAGRTYMVQPNTSKAKYLAQAADHYNRREYERAREFFRQAVNSESIG
tara:strand:- start:6959 stop:7135 length:177 start_codon:yes stop_codon:yes gene_type:complete